MAHPQLQQVRQQYCFCRGYCGVSETGAGGELTVDHFRPLAADGDEGYGNPVYACVRCNLDKGDFQPTPDDLAHGRRVLHPLHDNMAQHLHQDERSGFLEPLTETGRFHIALLQLNRPALVRQRLRRHVLRLLEAKHRLLEIENTQLREAMEAQEDYIGQLHRILGLPYRREE